MPAHAESAAATAVALASPGALMAGALFATEPEEQARSMGMLDQHYEQLSCGPFEGNLRYVRLGSLTLFREELGQSVYQTGCAPAGQITFATGCELSEAAYWNGRHIRCDTVIAFAPGREFELTSPRRAVCVGFSLPARTADSLDEGWADDSWDQAFRTQDTWTDAQPARLSQKLLGMMDAARSTPTLLAQPTAHDQLIDELIEDLLDRLRGNVGAGQKLRAGNYPRIAKRARALMLARMGEPFKVEELCAEMGCSRRALQYAFQSVFGISPVHYARVLRLNAARAQLMKPQADTSVLDIAARVGFWHFPRFAQEYERMFGELPSATLARQRGRALSVA